MSQGMIVTKIVYNRMPKLKGEAKLKAREIVWTTALEIERDTKRAMEGPKHGRTYRRGAITRRFKEGGKKWKQFTEAGARVSGGKVVVGYKYHKASAPGEAPAVDLGKLRASYKAKMVSEEAAVVFSNSVYAARLELGGSDSKGRFIASRPSLRPAAAAAQPGYLKRMLQMLRGLEG